MQIGGPFIGRAFLFLFLFLRVSCDKMPTISKIDGNKIKEYNAKNVAFMVPFPYHKYLEIVW